MITKKCLHCHQILPIQQFRPHSVTGNPRNICVSCIQYRDRQYYQKVKQYKTTPTKPTQKAILELLSDGQWHNTQEIRDIGGIKYDARLCELRQYGYLIEKARDFTVNAGWQYRLTTEPIRHNNSIDKLLQLLNDNLWHANTEILNTIGPHYARSIHCLRKQYPVLKQYDPEFRCYCYKLGDVNGQI